MERTPEQWRDRLVRDLANRIPVLCSLQEYIDAEHPMPTAPSNCTPEYRRLARLATLNLCELVVDAVSERLTVVGVRRDGTADMVSWRELWQANELDAEQITVHESALGVGRSFVLVWPSDSGAAVITPEDPCEVIVAYEPGTRHRVAALKVFADTDAGLAFATLWRPGVVYRWVAPLPKSVNLKRLRWREPVEADGFGAVSDPMPAQFGDLIPVVEFVCRPNMQHQPRPELSRSVLRVQDRINKTRFDQTVLGEAQAFPQRYTIGIEIEHNADGTAVNPLKSGPERVWALAASDGGDASSAKVGQLDAADLSQHGKQVEADVHFVASISRTPVTYLLGDLVNVSTDTVRMAEQGLVKKAERHQVVFGERWEEVVRLAALASDLPEVAGDPALEVVWAHAGSRSEAEVVDAALKKKALDVPFGQLAEDIGYTPTQISAMQAERAGDAVLAAFGQPLDPARRTDNNAAPPVVAGAVAG